MKIDKTKRVWEVKPEKQTGRRSKAAFYHTHRWRKVRALYFIQNPLCVHCKGEGKVTAAKELDHIKPVTLGGLIWSWDNLQGLCTHHHAVKSGKERQMNRRGRGAKLL